MVRQSKSSHPHSKVLYSGLQNPSPIICGLSPTTWQSGKNSRWQSYQSHEHSAVLYPGMSWSHRPLASLDTSNSSPISVNRPSQHAPLSYPHSQVKITIIMIIIIIIIG